MPEIVEKLREVSVGQQLSKGLQAATALARAGRDAISLDEVVKALDTQEVGGGSEFVFTGMSTTLINQVRQDLIVSSLFKHINMPTNPYKVPVELGPATAYLVPENTADTGQSSIIASQMGSANITFNAKSIGAMTRISKELTQDTIIPIVPLIQENLLRGLGNGLEDALVNGDASVTHQDTDTAGASASAVAKAWPGLRKLALANNYKVDLSTFDITGLRNMRKAMGKFGINPRNLILIVSNSAYVQMLNWAEVITFDKYGDKSTALTGELLRIDGIPVVVSPYMRQDLNATGVNGASGNTKTGVLLVHRDAFIIGDRQDIELDQTDEPKAYRRRSILADMRVDFLPTQPITGNSSVVFGYNITA